MAGAKFILLGDANESLKYAPQGLHELKRFRLDGRTSGSKTVILDGVTVRVVLDPQAGDKVYLEATGRKPVNAFLDTYPKLEMDPDTGRPKSQFLVDVQNLTEHRIPSDPPKPSDPPISMHGIRVVGYPFDSPHTRAAHPEDYVNTTDLPVEPQTPLTLDPAGHKLPTYPDQRTNKWRETYEKFLPTKFTGHMRKLMQFAHGVGFWTDPAKVPVDYHYGNSFGLVKHRAAYFLVRITKTQVDYVPADIAVTHIKDDRGVPREVLRLKQVSLDRAVKIATLALKGTPWSDEIGWSFSYDKTEAAIVLDVGDQVGRNSYHATSLATIQFSFDAQTGVPNGATATQTAQKIFSNHHRMNSPGDYGLFNVPVFGSEDGRAPATLHNESVNFGPSSYVGADVNRPPPGYVADAIPIHVWYAEGKGQQLCTYSYVTVPEQSTTTSGDTELVYTQSGAGPITSSKPALDRGWSGTKATSSYVRYGFSVNGSPLPNSTGIKNSNYTTYMNRGSYLDMGATHTNTAFSIVYDAQSWADPNAPIASAYQTVNQSKVGTALDIESVATIEAGGGATSESSCTLSVLDREAALIAAVSTSNQYTKTETSSIGKWLKYTSGDPLYNSLNTTGSAQFGMYDADIQRIMDERYYSCLFHLSVRSVAVTSDPYRNDVVVATPWNSYSPPSNMTWTTGTFTGCGGNPTFTLYTGTQNSVYMAPAQYPRTTVTPASDTSTLTLFSGAQALAIPPAPFRVNNRLFLLHPLDNSLAYRSTAAAFDPALIAYDTAPGVATVAIHGQQFPVENKLFGWLGVV